jgi:hypothetical protein
MDPTPDDLAGVVDLFGSLTRSELGEAAAELAYKRAGEYDPGAFVTTIDAAVRSYHLVAVDAGRAEAAIDEGTDEDLLVAGPVAFPQLPDGAADLPHILDVPEREVDPEAATAAATARFRRDAARAVDAGDTDRIRTLLDVSYELEAWGSVDLAGTRELLDEALP